MIAGTLQWGENPEEGQLYEPARAQLLLKLGGPDKTKAVAVLDIRDRALTYLDANIPLPIFSCGNSPAMFAKLMPPLLEGIKAAPTMATLFGHAKTGSIPVIYSDAQAPIIGNGVVFQPTHPDSQITQLPIESILLLKG